MTALDDGLLKTPRILERRLSEALTSEFPRRMLKRKWELAIDFHLSPYYGQPFKSRNELYYGKPKQGTKKFHAYASACIIEYGHRYTVALTAVRRRDSLVDVLQRLLEQIRTIGLKIRCVLLDREFFNVAVVQFLQNENLPFLMPIMIRGRKPKRGRKAQGLRAIKQRSAGWYKHMMKNSQQQVTVNICVGYRRHKNRKDKKQVTRKLLFAAWNIRGTPTEIRERYRKRFGIESSYRQMRQARIYTCTRNPRLRLFFMAVALLLRNIWVWIHLTKLSEGRGRHMTLHLEKLRFKRMLDWIVHEIVDQYHDGLPDAADVAAWDEFLAIYQPLIYRLAVGKGIQHADALDLVQEVLLAVSRSVDRWSPDPGRGRFRDWLFRIARNLMINFLTRKKHKPIGSGDSAIGALIDLESAQHGEETALFDREYRREVFRWAADQARVDEFGPLAVKEILRIGIQAASGLAAAHAQGVVHRDVKPSNILLENDVERVLLTDFGLARVADDASMTRSGIVAGTPHYMSPEQANGAAVDPRSDLFSLGAVLYFMATGHPPFRAERTMAILNRICNDRQRPAWEVNSDIPVELSDLIDRLLEKKPQRRFASAEQVQAELARQLQRSPLGHRSRFNAHCRRWWRRWKRRVAYASLAALGVAAAAGFAGVFDSEKPSEEPQAIAANADDGQSPEPAENGADGVFQPGGELDQAVDEVRRELQRVENEIADASRIQQQGTAEWDAELDAVKRDLSRLEQAVNVNPLSQGAAQ
eukprot:g10475.t1